MKTLTNKTTNEVTELEKLIAKKQAEKLQTTSVIVEKLDTLTATNLLQLFHLLIDLIALNDTIFTLSTLLQKIKIIQSP